MGEGNVCMDDSNNLVSDKEIKRCSFFSVIALLLLIFVCFLGFRNSISTDILNFLNNLIIIYVLVFYCHKAFMIINPGEAVVLTFLGKYKGTIKNTTGLYLINIFYNVEVVSTKKNVYQSDILKLNDKSGNQLELSVIVDYQINNVIKSFFYVEDIDDFVEAQIKIITNKIVSINDYEKTDLNNVFYSNNINIINNEIKKVLNKELEFTGILINDVKINQIYLIK